MTLGVASTARLIVSAENGLRLAERVRMILRLLGIDESISSVASCENYFQSATCVRESDYVRTVLRTVSNHRTTLIKADGKDKLRDTF